MMIWFALLIPILTCSVLYLFFNHKTLWWEFVIPLAASLVLIVGCYSIAIWSATYDLEYWGNYYTKAEYFEDWNELVTYTVTRTDSKGNAHTEIKTRVDYHPERWIAELNDGSTIGISKKKYNQLKDLWQNEEFVDLRRSYHSNDGDKYVSNIVGGDTNIVGHFSIHSYTNKIQASKSVFKFEKVDPKEYGLFEYPEVVDNYVPSVLGNCMNKEAGIKTLDCLNAKYGSSKKVRVWVLVFNDKPLQAGLDQENYWLGGNKNEFVVCIGLSKDGAVSWCYPFSWSEKDLLKIQVRQYVNEMKPFDLAVFTGWLKEKIVRDFEKKSFKDFNYISIEPSLTAIIITFILTFLLNIGISMYVICNEFDESGNLSKFNRIIRPNIHRRKV